jgi:hypothetical protein
MRTTRGGSEHGERVTELHGGSEKLTNKNGYNIFLKKYYNKLEIVIFFLTSI